MRILQLHSNFITYKPVEKELTQAEEVEKTEVHLDDIVVLFTSVEEGDTVQVSQRAINDVRAFLGKLKVNKILIYPFAHLSSNLSKPFEAFSVIKEMEYYAKQKGIDTYRAPFGWNKQFTISIKGHPLAEQARAYAPEAPMVTADAPMADGGVCEAKKDEEPVSAALKAEDSLKSFWHILQVDGSLVPVE
ncbi:MAG: threonyl-tRNA synthetase editing domain-containing protein, partial [Candidatus Bathyarchaeota archaeon]|nr:threonyl-tRNA synthetase editing domain-containing protein [Candidatus Termiticorpusculum sp.]